MKHNHKNGSPITRPLSDFPAPIHPYNIQAVWSLNSQNIVFTIDTALSILDEAHMAHGDAAGLLTWVIKSRTSFKVLEKEEYR